MKILGRSFRYVGFRFGIILISIIMLSAGWLHSMIRTQNTLLNIWWSIEVENTIGVISSFGLIAGVLLWIVGKFIFED